MHVGFVSFFGIIVVSFPQKKVVGNCWKSVKSLFSVDAICAQAAFLFVTLFHSHYAYSTLEGIFLLLLFCPPSRLAWFIVLFLPSFRQRRTGLNVPWRNSFPQKYIKRKENPAVSLLHVHKKKEVVILLRIPKIVYVAVHEIRYHGIVNCTFFFLIDAI